MNHLAKRRLKHRTGEKIETIESGELLKYITIETHDGTHGESSSVEKLTVILDSDINKLDDGQE